jgi:type IV secretion system protein VirB9
MKNYLLPFLIVTTGCLASKQPITLVPVNQPTQEIISSELDIPFSEGIFSYDTSPEIKAALKEFSSTGKAPIVKRAGFSQFPYGEMQPVLNCQPNYGCDIELQPGEKVSAVIIGNESLWDYLIWESNQTSTAIAHITIGPRTVQTKTNAIIGTDRRTYHLELISTAKSEYTRSAKFYYPREQLHDFQAKQQRKSKQQARKATIESLKDSLPHQVLSFDWEVDAPRKLPWKPSRVFDDGAHIYILFPENVLFEDFPGVYTPTDSGELTQPIWRTVTPDASRSREKGSYLMVDGMFEEIQLLGGFRGKQEKVTIKRMR